MSRQGTRHLGSICRIYKNATGKTIALDKVSAAYDKLTIATSSTTQKFHREVNGVDVCRTLLHLETGGSRVVTEIQMIGTYSSVEENGGNFLVVQYNQASVDENNILFSLEPYVAKLGDTL